MYRFFWLLCCSVCFGSEPFAEYGFIEFKKNDAVLTVTTGPKAILKWENFSLTETEKVEFVQPSTDSIIVVDMMGEESCEILGTIHANANLFLINAQRIMLGENSYCEAKNLTISAHPVCCPYAIIDGALEGFFESERETQVVNLGRVKAIDGDVALLGTKIENKGALDAFEGTVFLAAGKEIIFQPLIGDKFSIISSTHGKEKYPLGLLNEGWITAAQTQLRADGNCYKQSILHAGFIDAIGKEKKDSYVHFLADKGTIDIQGAIVAGNANKKGGNVQVEGEEIYLRTSSNIDVSGENGGGTIFVGANTLRIACEEGSTLYADALEMGNGGKITLHGNDSLAIYGEMSVRGGEQSGDGGTVYISSKQHGDFFGEVDLSAPFGTIGRLIFDP